MRLSIDEYDTYDEETRNLLHHVEIYLDDERQPAGVTVADEEEGYIIRYARDDAGNLKIARGDDCYETERIEGRVKIVDRRTLPGYQIPLPLAAEA